MVSLFALKALSTAYKMYSAEAWDEARAQWTEAGLLENDEILRRIANCDDDAAKIVQKAGIFIPLSVFLRLRDFFGPLNDTVLIRKRQRTAVASQKRDLAKVLKSIKIFADLEFQPRPGFEPPTKESADEAMNTMVWSLFKKEGDISIDLPPEQTAREFASQVKRLLPDHHFNEARLPTEDVKRPDVFVMSADMKNAGVIELKKFLRAKEFSLTLGQIAVYGACWASTSQTFSDQLRFVVLAGIRTKTGAAIDATAGICYFGKDTDGECYVQMIRHEHGPEVLVRMDKSGKASYDYEHFIAILQRLYWVGGNAILHVSGDLGSDIDD